MSVPSPETRAELGAIAQRMRALAPPNGTAAPVLGRIADELAAGGASLAGADLARSYPVETLLPEPPARQRSGLEGWLGVFRDVLVFAPIALTWWRLGDALDQYRRRPGEDPFLLAWAKGFPLENSDRPTTATLGDSAFQIVLLIGVVVLLTLTVHLLRTRRLDLSGLEQRRQQLGADLATATFLLTTRMAVPGRTIDARELHGLADRIVTSSDQLENALRRSSEEIVASLESGPASRIHQALDSWTASAAGLTRVAEGLTAPARTLEAFIQLRAELARDELRLRTALEALVAELRKAQEISGDEIHRHDLSVAAVRDLATILGESVQTFTERTELLIDSTRGIWHLVERFDSRQDGWGGGADGGPAAGSGGAL